MGFYRDEDILAYYSDNCSKGCASEKTFILCSECAGENTDDPIFEDDIPNDMDGIRCDDCEKEIFHR